MEWNSLSTNGHDWEHALKFGEAAVHSCLSYALAIIALFHTSVTRVRTNKFLISCDFTT